MIMIDWKAEANRAVEFVGEQCFEAHRGLLIWDYDRAIVALFFNDGQQDRGHLCRLRKILEDHGIQELAFAQTNNGYSYVVLCDVTRFMVIHADESEAFDTLPQMPWEAWRVSLDDPTDAMVDCFEQFQKQIAQKYIFRWQCPTSFA